VLLMLVACGGKTHATKPAAEAPPEKPDPFWEWHKQRPKAPVEAQRTTKFTPPQQCGQGPYRFVVDTLSSKFQEGLEVTICTPNGFKGSFSYAAPQRSKEEKGFGEDTTANQKCRADATVIATAGSSSGGGSGKASGKPGKASATAAKPIVTELKGEVIATGEECPKGLSRVTVIDHDYLTYNQATIETAPPLPRGQVVLELWSELPNDLRGAMILVQQRGTRAGFTADDWKAYRAAYDTWSAQHDEKLAESRAQGHKWTTVEPVKATKQPPPPRAEVPTPKPSPNAAWIPGYWSDDEWSAGFWRVPKEDIEQEKTVEAPTPPPAPRVEVAPVVAVRKAVWTPGYWMWNGAGYIWIAGSWRIPEAAGMTWVAPAWRPSRRGGSIYVPGGFVRLRRR
jgi:hypothetical protein